MTLRNLEQKGKTRNLRTSDACQQDRMILQATGGIPSHASKRCIHYREQCQEKALYSVAKPEFTGNLLMFPENLGMRPVQIIDCLLRSGRASFLDGQDIPTGRSRSSCDTDNDGVTTEAAPEPIDDDRSWCERCLRQKRGRCLVAVTVRS